MNVFRLIFINIPLQSSTGVLYLLVTHVLFMWFSYQTKMAQYHVNKRINYHNTIK